MPLLRPLLLLLAALLFLGEAPLHARHALEMTQPGHATMGEMGREPGIGMAGHEHHSTPATPGQAPAHRQDHPCCLPSVGALTPLLHLPTVTAWLQEGAYTLVLTGKPRAGATFNVFRLEWVVRADVQGGHDMQEH